jgi:serine/threonine-protein kinase
LRCWDDDAEICSYDDARLQATFVGPTILDGKYRLDQRLGQGGMGVVYRARHLALQKPFALKLISTGGDKAFLTRFRLEAEVLGKLQHPNIVAVTDFGIDTRGGGCPYLVMEYLEGSTLADHCRRRGPLARFRSIARCQSSSQSPRQSIMLMAVAFFISI